MITLEISIQLDDYECANLLHLLNFIPNNGEWRNNIINKINDKINELPDENKQFNKNVLPNSGITIKHMKKHIDLLEWKAKHRNY